MKRYSEYELTEQAKNLGATHSRQTFSINRYDRLILIPSTRHFFNKNDEEVGYFTISERLYQLTGLIVFNEPRIWSDKNKLDELTGEPVDFNLIVKSEFKKANIIKRAWG